MPSFVTVIEDDGDKLYVNPEQVGVVRGSEDEEGASFLVNSHWFYTGYTVEDLLGILKDAQFPVPSPAPPEPLETHAEPSGCPQCGHDKWEHHLTYDGRLACLPCRDDETREDCYVITPQHIAWKAALETRRTDLAVSDHLDNPSGG